MKLNLRQGQAATSTRTLLPDEGPFRVADTSVRKGAGNKHTVHLTLVDLVDGATEQLLEFLEEKLGITVTPDQ